METLSITSGNVDETQPQPCFAVNKHGFEAALDTDFTSAECQPTRSHPPQDNEAGSMIVKALAGFFILSLVVLTIVPASFRPETGVQHDFEHFAAFATCGFLCYHAVKMRFASLLLCAIAFAIVLELLQIPLPTRHARLEDFSVNALGGCLGATIALLIDKLGLTLRRA